MPLSRSMNSLAAGWILLRPSFHKRSPPKSAARAGYSQTTPLAQPISCALIVRQYAKAPPTGIGLPT